MNIAYALPVPQRYYVPSRIRNMHRHRLEAAGLWVDQPAESTRLQFSTTTDHKEQIAQAFQRSKVRLLGCFGSRVLSGFRSSKLLVIAWTYMRDFLGKISLSIMNGDLFLIPMEQELTRHPG